MSLFSASAGAVGSGGVQGGKQQGLTLMNCVTIVTEGQSGIG